jgi:hypothetical protein
MNLRQTWILGGCFVAGCLLLAAALGPWWRAEKAGRYQAVLLDPSSGHASSGSFLIVDTATGRSWTMNPRYAEHGQWTDLGSPPAGK